MYESKIDKAMNKLKEGIVNNKLLNSAIKFIEKINQDSLSHVENLEYEDTIQKLKAVRYGRLK